MLIGKNLTKKGRRKIDRKTNDAEKVKKDQLRTRGERG